MEKSSIDMSATIKDETPMFPWTLLLIEMKCGQKSIAEQSKSKN